MRNESSKGLNGAIRVMLFSKYPLVREGLKLLIESKSAITVVGTHATNGDGADFAKIVDADVAILDISSDDRPEIISDLAGKMPNLRLVVIVDGDDLDSQAGALEHGAVGIVRKEQSVRMLIEAIRQTHMGETWLNQVLLSKILKGDASKAKPLAKSKKKMDIDSLTARELEVVRMIGEGLKNKEVAERLSISDATVRHHLSSIYGKIGVDNRLNLIISAYERGWIKPNELHLEDVP